MLYNPVELIVKKRNKGILSQLEIDALVQSYIKGELPDYQMSAMLMSIFFNGMQKEEIVNLTGSYINSGSTISFPDELNTIDKHSTGGVGDKISIILAPIMAACGAFVPMISGRGLGHTGGTLDKLEAIPGFKTNFSESEFKKMVLSSGLAIIAQSEKLVPADKKIYALRDVTGTVESLPLITASIMSKKIAEGAKNLVIDLKVGTGAFMKNMTDAENLAKSLISTGNAFGQKVRAVFTSMNSPIGYKIGNALEIIECIEYLKGNKIVDLEIITNALLTEMLTMSNLAKDKAEALKQINQVIDNGKALDKFREMVENQGGNPRIIDDYQLFGTTKYKLPIIAEQDGYIKYINSQEIGYAMIQIDAGRKVLTSQLNYNTGCEIFKKVGDSISKGEIIGHIFCESEETGQLVAKRIRESMNIQNNEPQSENLILSVI